MGKFIKSIVLLAFALAFIPLSAQARTVLVEVDGMHCSACAVGVKAALESLPEVADVSIDTQQATASLTLKDINGEPSEASIGKAIDAAGYSVGAIHY